MATVLETTVKNGFCCGCGVCAGMCPKNALRMEWNPYGEYNPVRIQDCSPECGLCVKVCPFTDGSSNEDFFGEKLYASIPSIQHRDEVGYYLSVAAGAVTSLPDRLHSSSGGCATWFLSELLSQNIVDTVICVHHSTDKDRLFGFTLAKNRDDVHASAGSFYYPVEISDVLKFIRETPGRYAIIGLPCLLKGIRLAQERSNVLRERISMLVGLACANQKSSYFTKYAAWKSGVKGDPVWVSFRKKNPEQHLAKFFTFQFRDCDGKSYLQSWSGELSTMYQNKCFTLHSCDCCDDTFAECGDVCFMDAWLPDYICEPRGTSVWMSRSKLADAILENGVMSGEVVKRSVSVDVVLAGQAAVRWKREMLGYRMFCMREVGGSFPMKRIRIHDGSSLSVLERAKVKKALQIQKDGRELCCTCNGDYSLIEKWFANTAMESGLILSLRMHVNTSVKLLKMGISYFILKIRCDGKND